MNALIVIAVIIAVVIIIVINNNIITQSNQVNQAWSDVITQERAKMNIIPKVERLVTEYKEFETNLMTEVTKLREAIAGASNNGVDVNKLQEIEKASNALSRGLNVAVEAYPDLKANTLYLQLAQEIKEQEENVAAAIRIFNSNVATFNTAIQSFPASMVNANFTKKKAVKSYENDEYDVGFKPQLNN